MKKAHRPHEPHLTVKESTIPAGGEWMPRLNSWTIFQAAEGSGYCLQPESRHELETGTVLLVSGDTQVTFRASQLTRLSLQYFSVVPRRLGGLLTLNEQSVFQAATSRKESVFQVLPPCHPVARRMKELCSSRVQEGLLFRLKLLELFVEVFASDLSLPPQNAATSDATERLRGFLKETPSSELLEMSFNELAYRTRCTSRHLSRIFREVTGLSFRNIRAELRLARARELLATSDSKIVDIALESGYKSLSLFNLMFSRKFGISPGKWRDKFGSQRLKSRRSALVFE